MVPAQVIAWIDKCQQNIERMQQDGIDKDNFFQQYNILSQIVKVVHGEAYFSGTQYNFKKEEIT
jgi:uncharacterized protein YktA (UPF0223 family)